MANSIMQLEEFFITRLNINWVEGEEGSQKAKCSVSIEPAVNPDNNRLYRLKLRVKLHPDVKKSGYAILSDIVGY
ncbi:MAG: hypothetical protein ACYC25_16070, partial [Paludibacter sp.]